MPLTFLQFFFLVICYSVVCEKSNSTGTSPVSLEWTSCTWRSQISFTQNLTNTTEKRLYLVIRRLRTILRFKKCVLKHFSCFFRDGF